MSDQLAKLKQLQQLKVLRAQHALSAVKVEENALRRDLLKLNEHRRHSHDTDPSLLTMRAIGSDVLWQAWIDRTQADLITDLAKVLVRKEPFARRVARETGREDVVTGLHQKALREDTQKRSSKRLDDLLNLASMRAARNTGNAPR